MRTNGSRHRKAQVGNNDNDIKREISIGEKQNNRHKGEISIRRAVDIKEQQAYEE